MHWAEIYPSYYLEPNYTLSYYITELHPILIHYQTIPYPNTLPNYTLSLYLAEVSFHMAFTHNSIRRRHN